MNDNTSNEHCDIWPQVLSNIKAELSEQSFKTWFECVDCYTCTPDKAVLLVPDKFYAEWLEDHYKEIIRSAFYKFLKSKPVISYKVAAAKNAPGNARVKTSPPPLSQKTKDALEAKMYSPSSPTTSANLNETYTFDHFVVGPGNRFAHAAAVAISQSPSKTYNPFFVYGPSGLGKTHLLQGIAHEIKQRFPDKKVHYTSSEAFTNALINAIHQRKTTEFRQKFRSLDVLIIDDIHFIAGKESTQEEFFHTFNTLYDAKKQIVLSSDRTPKEIPSLESRLLSRFEWGLITDILPPDFETRVAILKKKLERESVEVSNEILFYIAEHIKTNIRELEGALIRVCAYATLTERTITLPIVENILQTSVTEEKKKITIDLIQQYVAEAFNTTSSDLRSKKRSKTITYPRHLAMFLARKHTHHSFPEIGDYFGGRGHTAVMHACGRIQERMEKKDSSVKYVDEIEQRLFKTTL
jgi:chromosomal replication initiator protein